MLAGMATSVAGQTLCKPQEEVEFSCPVNQKLVSLCVTQQAGSVTQIAYRFGVLGKVENEYAATLENGKVFFFDVAPAGTFASIRQVWFDKGPYRYMMTECLGRACPFEAGVTVYNEDKILMNQRCGESAKTFSENLVEFSSSAAKSTLKTSLIKSGADIGNDVTRIYDVPEAF